MRRRPGKSHSAASIVSSPCFFIVVILILMEPESTFDVAVVGHFSIDSIKLPSRPKPYAFRWRSSLRFTCHSEDWAHLRLLYPRLASDFPETYMKRLREEGVDAFKSRQSSRMSNNQFRTRHTTRDLSSRNSSLKAQGSPITLADLPSRFHAKAIHVAPIAGEIPFEVVERLKHSVTVFPLILRV